MAPEYTGNEPADKSSVQNVTLTSSLMGVIPITFNLYLVPISQTKCCSTDQNHINNFSLKRLRVYTNVEISEDFD